jgi:glycerate kinase
MRRVDGLEVDEAPVADGGEGTAEVLHRSLGGTWQSAAVSDPLGRATSARWLQLPDGTAVVAAAEPIGLPHLRLEELDPVRASSRGLGELLLAVVATRPRACSPVWAALRQSTVVRARAVVGGWLKDVPIRVACDVRNPLLGGTGRNACLRPAERGGPRDGRGLEGAAGRDVGAGALPTCRGRAQVAGSGQRSLRSGGERSPERSSYST